jgi:Protein of unknown function (DUF2771)
VRPIVLALLAALALAGCSEPPPPQVTFAAGTASVMARPTQACDLKFTECHNDPEAPVKLAVPPGTPLQVTVPQDVAQTPWQIVFSYRDAAGAQQDQRSRVFPAGERSTYTLELPEPADRLLVAQVQQYGPPPQADPATGEIQFPIRTSWVLTVAPS